MEDIQLYRRYKNNSFFSPSPRQKPKRVSVSFRDLEETPKATSNVITPSLHPPTYKTIQLLCKAVEDGDKITISEILEECGDAVDVNEVLPVCSMTLLHLSVGFSENQTPIVELLLRHGGNPNNRLIEEGLSPLHLSACYDYDKVMALLMKHGGDPLVTSKDGQSCYDIVRNNVEEECNDKCFALFFRTSPTFRKSLGGSRLRPLKQSPELSGGSDGFYSCDSQFGSETSQNDGILHTIARKLFPNDYANWMTEDESGTNADNSDSSDDDGRKKLTTIAEEESGVGSATSSPCYYNYNTPSPQGRGIASITAPIYVLTDDETSMSVLATDHSCVNSTPPITPLPTQAELLKLRETLKTLKIPVTPTTFGVISKYTDSDSRLDSILTPKPGTGNFSSELQFGIQNMNLINEWGKHKIDFLHSATSTVNTSKSFYNYLLLDPRVIKRVNFSAGGHLKAQVIHSSEKFEKFLQSIFYIGKAHGKRPLDHFRDAKEKFMELGKKPLKAGEKIDTILEIWKAGLGVNVVSLFHHSSEREANVNEACMIDAMGLVELSNLKKGSYSGTVVSGWSQKTKNQLGSNLLYKGFCNFAVSEQKQFYPQDF